MTKSALTLVSNGILLCKIYQFKTLSPVDQDEALAELIHRDQIGCLCEYTKNRIQHVIALCKELRTNILSQNLFISKEEQDMLHTTRLKFQQISDIQTLNLCLLFWLITKDPTHKFQLQQVIRDPHSPVRETAQLIPKFYLDVV